MNRVVKLISKEENDLTHKISPENILPEQLPDRYRRHDPILRFWTALFHDGIHAAFGPLKGDRSEMDRLEARRWIAKRSFSVTGFDAVCEIVGHNPKPYRDMLELPRKKVVELFNQKRRRI